MTNTRTTAIANTEMASIWDGEEGDEWTENADRYDATDRWIVARFDAEVGIDPTDRVLDVGCGTGKSTRTAARHAEHGWVLGIDLSTRMLDHAARQSEVEGLANITYVRGDAQVHPFEPEAFDVAISTFGAMFFVDPVAAFSNIGRSLRRGSRIAFLTWQRFEDNRWLTAIVESVGAPDGVPIPPAGEPGPFGLAAAVDVERIVERAGFVDGRLIPFTEPFWLGSDAADAFEFVTSMGLVRGLLERLTPGARARAVDKLHELLVAHETADGVLLESATWLITAQRP